jgi:1-pyrroline-4-hydroxy-2-carboxylate deaminase
MQQQDWQGVIPAITTPFLETFAVDHARLAQHVQWLVDHGCRGIVALGSLGEAQTLSFDEKISILETIKRSLGDRVPVVAGIAGLSTTECVALARRAENVGCDGLMVLPPYVYRGDWRESKTHFEAVIAATPLSCMLYNNPIAYGTDVSPTEMRELALHENLHAVKESSGDVRRITAIREVNGDRFVMFAGMDDAILESIPMGARGWIAGLVNALPDESVRLVEAGLGGRWEEARTLYEWFLPLLRLDTVPKFVQLIKLVQSEVGQGNAIVRAPRLQLEGKELADTLSLVRDCLSRRPSFDGSKSRRTEPAFAS